MRPNPACPCVVALLALTVLAPICAQAPATVALSDFVVNSANPSFAYLGKGFAEIVAFEIKKAPQVKLVDREQRNKLLEEMEFALSGMTDPSAQLEIGKLLSVQFLVSGSITDMGGPLLVSLSMVDVQTGVVVWNDQLTEKSGRYAYIGAYFGKSLLKHFNATVSKSTEQALASTKEGDSASVVALSKGIEALDKGDKDEAKKQLRAAKKIDPGNAVAQAFLDKLAKGTSKFAVIPDFKYSFNNPANLAFIEKDSVFMGLDVGSPGFLTGKTTKEAWVPLDETYQLKSYYLGEFEGGMVLGYTTPMGKWAGFGAQAFSTNRTQTVRDVTLNPDQNAEHYTSMPVGGNLSFGWSPAPWLALGLGASAGYSLDNNPAEPDYGMAFYGGEIGFLLKNPGGNLMLSCLVAYNTLTSRQFDMEALPDPDVGEVINPPIHMDLTGTMALGQSRDFAVFKFISDSYGGAGYGYPPFLQLIPAYEHWFGTGVSLRLGGILTMVPLDYIFFGFGGTLGATVILGPWEFDLGVTYRNRPSYTIVTEMVAEPVFNLGIRRNGLFVTRK